MDQENAPAGGLKRSHADYLSPTNSDPKRQRLTSPDAAAHDAAHQTSVNPFGAIASAISGAFGYARQTQPQQQPQPPSQQNGDAAEHQDAVNGHPTPDPTTAIAPANPPSAAPVQPQAETTPAAPPPIQVPRAIPPQKRVEVQIPTFRPAIKLKALKGTQWDTGEPTRKSTAKKAAPSPAPKKPTPKPRGRKPASAKAATNRPADADGIQHDDEANAPESAAGTPTKSRLFDAAGPKGILTPTKKRGPRPNKSVTFDANGEVFFKDLPKSPVVKKRKYTPRRRRDEEEDDGIVCGICTKPTSKPPNEIILCDNCDFAVHQECYEVSEVPEGDWLCKSCAQDDVLKTPKAEKSETAVEPTLQVAKVAEVPEIPNLDQHLPALQRVLLNRCTGRRRIRMFGQDDASEKVRQLVEQTVLAGEGNSLLLIGPRGSGKTTLVENTIWDLSQEHKHSFHVVRLNGFIHTDDKLALKEIWRQLGKEMAVEDDLLNRSNYADTMASLLALLSHPSEISGEDDGITSQSVLFVIDEFDMFAAHPRQTLLYNLFDIAQSRKAPIAVMGCTTRMDVVELLEKRVKSRFSHRYVYLSLPKTLPAFWQVCRQGLMLGEADATTEGIDTSVEGHAEFHKYWNHKIEELYKQRPFQDLLQYHYYTAKSAAAFFAEWILPLSSLSTRDLTLQVPSAGAERTSLVPCDSRLQLLDSLSELDLSLLIAAARLDIIAHTDTVNFAMVYDEYSSLVGKQRVQSASAGMLAVGGSARVWSRGVAGTAWERLVGLGLVVPSGIGGGRALGGHGGLEGRMWKVDVSLEEIPAAVKLSAVMAKWCREI